MRSFLWERPVLQEVFEHPGDPLFWFWFRVASLALYVLIAARGFGTVGTVVAGRLRSGLRAKDEKHPEDENSCRMGL